MRMRDALALLSVAALAACGGKPAGLVKMMGLTPNTSLQKDTREIRCFCPSCGSQIEMGVKACPKGKVCGVPLSWKDDYSCGFCNGTGVCQACFLMEKEGGKCFNCKGKGYITYQGKTPPCPDCKGKTEGKCTICKGSQKCDFCEGAQKISKDVIKERAKKPSEGEENVAPVEKKAEAPKPPAEEKKAEAPKEEKKAEEPKPADK